MVGGTHHSVILSIQGAAKRLLVENPTVIVSPFRSVRHPTNMESPYVTAAAALTGSLSDPIVIRIVGLYSVSLAGW